MYYEKFCELDFCKIMCDLMSLQIQCQMYTDYPVMSMSEIKQFLILDILKILCNILMA